MEHFSAVMIYALASPSE